MNRRCYGLLLLYNPTHTPTPNPIPTSTFTPTPTPMPTFTPLSQSLSHTHTQRLYQVNPTPVCNFFGGKKLLGWLVEQRAEVARVNGGTFLIVSQSWSNWLNPSRDP